MRALGHTRATRGANDKLPDLVEGARLLLDPGSTFEAALQRYREHVSRANVRRELLSLEPAY